MKRRNYLSFGLFIAIFFITSGNINAMGGSEKNQQIEVSGRVRLVGSSYSSNLVITGETREWYIDENEQDKFMHLQQQYVDVKGNEYYIDRYFANGTFAGRYYYLKNITVINPKKR